MSGSPTQGFVRIKRIGPIIWIGLCIAGDKVNFAFQFDDFPYTSSFEWINGYDIVRPEF